MLPSLRRTRRRAQHRTSNATPELIQEEGTPGCNPLSGRRHAYRCGASAAARTACSSCSLTGTKITKAGAQGAVRRSQATAPSHGRQDSKAAVQILNHYGRQWARRCSRLHGSPTTTCFSATQRLLKPSEHLERNRRSSSTTVLHHPQATSSRHMPQLISDLPKAT